MDTRLVSGPARVASPQLVVPQPTARATSLGADVYIPAGGAATTVSSSVSTFGAKVSSAFHAFTTWLGSIFAKLKAMLTKPGTPAPAAVTPAPISPVANPAAPVATPITPVATPAAPVGTPTPSVLTPAAPAATPASPAANPAAPSGTPSAPSATPAPVATPVPPPPPPPPPAPVPAPPVAPPPPPAPVASPSAPATPASNTPAGAKPPILKQFVQQGDPSAATYGASGSAWIYANDAQEITRIIKEAKAANQTPVFTQYNIPDRDNGGGSAGGASNLETYAAGVEANAKAIGDAAAVVVIEPDALAEGKDPAIVKRAVEIYKQNCPNARIYIDAGHALWPSDVNEIADKLVAAGVKDADGFSLNVSNFQWTTDSLKRGDDLVAALAKRDPALASKQFVVDTSRNGNGAGVDEAGKDTWGDPVKAKNGGPIMNGPLPSTETNDPHCAAFLWIKPPGFGDNRTRSATQFGGSGWVTPNQKPPLGP